MFNISKNKKYNPVLIAGPTASGKSSLALEIAKKHNGMIINADALQVYSCWRVVTARPDPEEESATPHRLYGHIERASPYSVGDWLREVKSVLIHEPEKLPIIVGGTGLYFFALTEGLAEVPPVPSKVRSLADEIITQTGVETLLIQLQEFDSETAQKIDQKNPARVQRAWEVWRATGRGLSAWQDNTPPPLLNLNEATAIVLDASREWLKPRIETRFQKMIEQGALDECRQALDTWDPSLPSSRAIGAKELIGYLNGEYSLDIAINLAGIATRQYAKRQRSWFRSRMRKWTWINPTDSNSG